MGFKDLDDVFDSSMPLPISGKIYKIPSVDAETGLWLQSVTQITAKRMSVADGEEPPELSDREISSLELDDDEETDFMQRMLGPALQEMRDDGVPWEKIKLVGQTATIRAMSGDDAAETFWNNGGVNPKARKQPTDRKPKAKPKAKGSAKSARQVSTATTTSRKPKA